MNSDKIELMREKGRLKLKFKYSLLLYCLFYCPIPATASIWNSCLKIVSQIGIINNKKIIAGVLVRALPTRKQGNSSLINTIEDFDSLETVDLQDNLALLQKIRAKEKLSRVETIALDDLIKKIELESSARTKSSNDIVQLLELKRPLSPDHSILGINRLISDLTTLVEARKNPLLTKHDKALIGNRIQLLLDSPLALNFKIATENNANFETFLSKYRSNLEPAELGKALNRKTLYAELAEKNSFDVAQKVAYPSGLDSDAAKGRNLVDQISGRMGVGFHGSNTEALDSRSSLIAGVKYIDKLIEAQRLHPSSDVNPLHLNQMRNTLESLIEGQGTTLKKVLNSPRDRASIKSKFPEQQKTIDKIFDEIDLKARTPHSIEEHEEFVTTLKGILDSQKLSDDEFDQLSPYYEKLRVSLESRLGTSKRKSSPASTPPKIQQTPSPSTTALSIVGDSKKVDENRFQSKLKDIANALDDKDLKPEDVASLKNEIRRSLNSSLTPESFTSIDVANNVRGNRLDEIEALADIREKLKDDPQLQSEITQRINRLLAEPIPVQKLRDEISALRAEFGHNRVRFPDAARSYSSVKTSALNDEEINLLNMRKSEYEKLQNEFNQFANYSLPTLPSSGAELGPAIRTMPEEKIPSLPGSTLAPRTPALMSQSPNRPLTAEEFRRAAAGDPRSQVPFDPVPQAYGRVPPPSSSSTQTPTPSASSSASTGNGSSTASSKNAVIASTLVGGALIAGVGTSLLLDEDSSSSKNQENFQSQKVSSTSTTPEPSSIPPVSTHVSTVVESPPVHTTVVSLPPPSPSATATAPAPAPAPASAPAPAPAPAPASAPAPTPSSAVTTMVPEEPAPDQAPIPTVTPAPSPTPAPAAASIPAAQPSPQPEAPAPYIAPYQPSHSPSPAPVVAPPKKESSNVFVKALSAIGNFFASIFKAILSIFGVK